MSLNRELEGDWEKVMDVLTKIAEKRPKDINAILFLIGVRELGHGIRNFSKEEKQDLMHIAICRLLSIEGYYELEGTDEDGWPHWKLLKDIPYHNITEQVLLLKSLIINYFYEDGILH